MELNYYYLSASEYAKATGINEATAKAQLNKGELEGFITEGGHYKIKVYKDESIDKQTYNKVLEENIELKTQLNNIRKIIGG